MKTLDETILIGPSLIRLFLFGLSSQLPIYLAFYAALNASIQEYEFLDDGILDIFIKSLVPVAIIVFLTIAMVVANRRLFFVEIGGENSLAPDVLKGAGNKRIDLSKEYEVKIAKGTIRLVQDKSKITLYRFVYSRADFERILSLVKI